MHAINLTVNGKPVQAEVEPRMHLADFLREELLLTGTHLGCEHGVCGACTVLIDDAPARACISFAVGCDAADVRTIEGFETDPLMRELRRAFSIHHALQCGYCTPGMLVTAYDIVRRLPGADEARVREELGGNLCRCTGYVGIVSAILEVLADPPDLESMITPAAAGASIPMRVATMPSACPSPSSIQLDRDATTPAATGSGATRLSRRVPLDLPPGDLWGMLQDTEAVVRCLPGAELTSPPDPLRRQPITYRFLVSIGPMRASFEGSAEVELDAQGWTGRIAGRGVDQASRTTSEGAIEFTVEQIEAEKSMLSVVIEYALKGPLAQFSRGALVSSVVDELLARFVDNLMSAAAGKDVVASAELGGIVFGLTALWRSIKNWLSGDRAR